MSGEKMLRKLGVLNSVPYKQCNNVKPSESHLFAAIRIEHVVKISNEYKEVLEALIAIYQAQFDMKFNLANLNTTIANSKSIIEKATGKTMEEIKGILNE